MNLYQKEKERIHIGHYYLALAAFMFLFFVQIQSQVSVQIREMTAHMVPGDSVHLIPTSPISIWVPAFWLGLIIELIYLNSKLFWIRERDVSNFILRKYDSLPIVSADLYKAKGKVLAKLFITHLVWSVLIYYGIIFLNYRSKALWFEAIPQILLGLGFGILLITIILVFDYLLDVHSRQYA